MKFVAIVRHCDGSSQVVRFNPNIDTTSSVVEAVQHGWTIDRPEKPTGCSYQCCDSWVDGLIAASNLQRSLQHNAA